MIFSVLFYNFILVITTLFSFLSSKFKNKYVKNILIFFSITVIVFVTSLRSLSVGTDNQVYFEEYEKIDPTNSLIDNIIFNFGNFEPGFIFFNHYFSKFHINYTGVLIFYSSLIWGLIYQTFRDQKNNFFIAVFLFYTNFLFFSFNGFRQAIASALIFYAVCLLLKGRSTWFFLVTIFAALFHFSAFLMLSLYFFLKINRFSISIWSRLFIFALIVPISYLYDFIFKIAYFFPFYGTYSGRDDFFISSNFTFGVFYQVLIGFLLLYYYKIVAIDRKKIFYFNVSLTANLLYNLFYSNPFINRLIIYFLFFQLYAFVYIFDYLIKNKKFDIIYLLLIIFIFVFCYRIFVNDSGVTPYTFK
jgi:transmembrane protein EpsG